MFSSVRIGVQIATFCLVSSTLIYGALNLWNPALTKPISVKALIGLSTMTLAMWLCALVEPLISGRSFAFADSTKGLLIGGITFLLSLFFVAYRQTHEHNLKLRAESAESNLNVLKNQMQPHFLFNSLNSLAELIDSNKEYASAMTQKLADLYREILENSKKQVASVESELSIIKKYLELEKLRFGDRLRYKISVSDGLERVFLPSLALQTLVENAVKHGVSKSIDGGEIDIRVERNGTGYKVRILNSGSEIVESDTPRGTGIANTKARLDLLYGEKHAFTFRVKDNCAQVSFWFSGEPFAN